MSRKKKPLPLLEHVEITGLAAEGKAMMKMDGMVVFVPYAVPGDVVDLQIIRKKHSYAEAEVVKFHKYSEQRVTELLCPHFGVCGGCKWQMLPYEEQLRFKQQQVQDTLCRIGHVEVREWLPILGSRQQAEYRNKLEFTFSNKKWLTRAEIESGETFSVMDAVGFHIPGAFDKVLDITCCRLMEDVNNRLRNGIREYAISHSLTFYDLRGQHGLLRNMMVRTAATGERMLLLQFCILTQEEQEQADLLLDWVQTTFPELTSLLWVNNTKCNDTIGDLDVHVHCGEACIYETMEGLRFKIGPKSFFQTNSEQAYELYKVVRDFAGLTGSELIYDLYTGTGTIANFVAREARRVIGIEYVPEAIEDARMNAQLNHLSEKTLFFAGDMKDLLTSEFIAHHGQPDVVITDPPRAGMHPDVVKTILSAAPQRIVYVSCNPATQARDLEMLAAQYSIEKVRPVDMFPHTHHVENVALLVKRNT